jgi:hypothetical protein
LAEGRKRGAVHTASGGDEYVAGYAVSKNGQDRSQAGAIGHSGNRQAGTRCPTSRPNDARSTRECAGNRSHKGRRQTGDKGDSGRITVSRREAGSEGDGTRQDEDLRIDEVENEVRR